MKPVATITSIFLTLISAMHLTRLALRLEVTVAGTVVPLWISLFGCLFTMGLAILLWRESRKPV